MINLGEIIGTYLMLMIGLGMGMYLKSTRHVVIGLSWALAIFVASAIGTQFGTADMNPVFSIHAFMQGQHSAGFLAGQLIGQVIGTLLAVFCLAALFDRQRTLPLQNYAAVPNNSHVIVNTVLEMLATTSLLIVAGFLSATIKIDLLRFLLIGLYIGVIITLLCKRTGASFNPTRDILPRFFWYLTRQQPRDYSLVKRGLISSNLGPLLALILVQFIFKK
ncbi:aquaporin [Lapidilactobacillus bayanensis]|uniref:aquaporin n=1 Tax=Lapidilactobacillus bayanensis TaxID=2485998 RepID=UPI000F7819C7|nr:aquaporin [Lapidilactobacillus bayanensis]